MEREKSAEAMLKQYIQMQCLMSSVPFIYIILRF